MLGWPEIFDSLLCCVKIAPARCYSMRSNSCTWLVSGALGGSCGAIASELLRINYSVTRKHLFVCASVVHEHRCR